LYAIKRRRPAFEELLIRHDSAVREAISRPESSSASKAIRAKR